MSTKKTTEQFIKESKEIYGDAYDYTDTVYNGTFKPITLSCKFHGVFTITVAKNHLLKGVSCTLCKRFSKGIESMSKYYDLDKYIVEDLSKHTTNNVKEQQDLFVKITCKEHGETRTNHLNFFTKGDLKNLCSICMREGIEKRREARLELKNKERESRLKTQRRTTNKLSLETIKGRCTEYFGLDISFKDFTYVNTKTSFTLICNKHNHPFKVILHKIKRDEFGCKFCKKERRFVLKEEQDELDFIVFKEKANKKYNNKFDYSSFKYKGKHIKGVIKCSLHGFFEQTPENHLKRTYGCQKCGADMSSGYTKNDYIKKCNGKLAKLYLVEFSKEDELFYKIGITKQTINKRFKGSKIPYKHSVIKYIEGEAGFIYDLETKIHNQLKEYKYEPYIKFGGNTECFIIDNYVKEVFFNQTNT